MSNPVLSPPGMQALERKAWHSLNINKQVHRWTFVVSKGTSNSQNKPQHCFQGGIQKCSLKREKGMSSVFKNLTNIIYIFFCCFCMFFSWTSVKRSVRSWSVKSRLFSARHFTKHSIQCLCSPPPSLKTAQFGLKCLFSDRRCSILEFHLTRADMKHVWQKQKLDTW